MSIKTYKKGQNISLSPHFKSDEFGSFAGPKWYSDTILIDDNLIVLLEKVFSEFNCKAIIINSGYRTAEHDKAVGGNGKGQHTLGKAADFKCKGQDGMFLPSSKICCYLQDSGVCGIGKINSKSVHVDTRSADSKWWGDEITGKRILDFYEYFGIKKELTKIDDIVNLLFAKGILSNKIIWIKKSDEDINVYWLLRKMANFAN